MSGVEIAGFVLATLPLMISALEHYRETSEVLETWWKIKQEYMKCMRNLKYHKVAFEENLEELLLPLIAEEERLQKLLKDPGGPEWGDRSLEAMLQHRLPKTYESYTDTIQEMKETILNLESALGMGKIHFQTRVTGPCQQTEKTPSGTRALIAHVTSVGMANIEYHSQRIKLALNKGPRQQLFDDFGNHNNRLRDILGSSDRLAELRRSRVTKKFAANAGVWKLWNHGNSLYNLLAASFGYRCQALHYASLLLQHRISPTVDFRVIFWFKAHLGVVHPGPSPWIWQDTSIKLLKDSKPLVITLVTPHSITPVFPSLPKSTSSQPIPSPHSTATQDNAPLQVAISSSNGRRSQRRSRIHNFFHHKNPTASKATVQRPMPSNGPTTTDPTVSHLTVPTNIPQATPVNSRPIVLKPMVSFAPPVDPIEKDPANPEITDLCTTIKTCPTDHPYGFLKEESRQYIVQPLCKANNKPPELQRFQIALILTSSHIQLHPTPWLNSQWSKREILFIYEATDPSKICTDQPYVSRSLSRALGQTTATTAAPNPASNYTFQNSIRNLGIILLELCFGKVVEDHTLSSDLGMAAADDKRLQFLKYCVATEWLKEVVEEAGPEYANAVNWCLHHDPGSTGADGVEERWREVMFSNVVEPLRRCRDLLIAV
ncbi:hypothetical protein LZ554_005021 [Drepanopeziza brunnea f. sp. 'monogermtubi']|nr:hypothetical protein LZ554_005021 [Drepanopeziza brunnea f. sp. 'monogermtubi']